MKQIQTKSGKILCVEVPKNDEFELDKALYFSLYNVTQGKSECTISNPTLNCKDLEIVGKLSELTEEDCEEFVEVTHYGGVDIGDAITQKVFKDYLSKNKISKLLFQSKESFISLLQSEGIDTSKKDELLIIKEL